MNAMIKLEELWLAELLTRREFLDTSLAPPVGSGLSSKL
jgi:hypothetical protein